MLIELNAKDHKSQVDLGRLIGRVYELVVKKGAVAQRRMIEFDIGSIPRVYLYREGFHGHLVVLIIWELFLAFSDFPFLVFVDAISHNSNIIIK